MKNKRIILILVLILAVGFAAVSTTLYINGTTTYSTNKNDFDVYFSGSELDGVDVSNIVIKDKKHIEYTSNELKSIGNTSSLMYEVTNDSTQYNATVTISCTPIKTDYIEVTLDPVTFDVAIGESKQGNIIATLTRVSEEAQDVLISCELKAIAKERESSEVADIDNRPYSISGVLKDAEGNPLSKKELAVFSDKQIIKTDKNGYFYVSNLVRGTHHIYYKEDGEYSDNEEDLKEYELALAATNGILKIKNKDYKIEDFKYGKDIEDEGIYCDGDWCAWLEMGNLSYADYDDLNDFLDDDTATLSLLNDSDTFSYMTNSNEIKTALKNSSKYESVYVPNILNSNFITNVNKYNLGLPCYLNDDIVGYYYQKYKIEPLYGPGATACTAAFTRFTNAFASYTSCIGTADYIYTANMINLSAYKYSVSRIHTVRNCPEVSLIITVNFGYTTNNNEANNNFNRGSSFNFTSTGAGEENDHKIDISDLNGNYYYKQTHYHNGPERTCTGNTTLRYIYIY